MYSKGRLNNQSYFVEAGKGQNKGGERESSEDEVDEGAGRGRDSDRETGGNDFESMMQRKRQENKRYRST